MTAKTAIDSGGGRYEMELQMHELSALHIAHQWPYGLSVYPSPLDMVEAIATAIQPLLEHPEFSYAEWGRFIVFRDKDHPDSIEIALRIGNRTQQHPNPDAPQPADA